MKAHLNPFRSQQIDALRYRFLDLNPESLINRLETMNYRAAIVGPHGSGKTTLLEELLSQIGEQGLEIERMSFGAHAQPLALETIRRTYTAARSRKLIVIDGAEQLGPVTWLMVRLLSRGSAGLLITCHTPGRLRTLISTRTTPKLLKELVAELLNEQIAPQDFELLKLYDRHDGNIRDVFRELYDLYAFEEDRAQTLESASASTVD